MAPRGPGHDPWDCVTSHGQRDFANAMKLRILRQESILDYPDHVNSSEEGQRSETAWMMSPANSEAGGGQGRQIPLEVKAQTPWDSQKERRGWEGRTLARAQGHPPPLVGLR